MTAPDLRQIFAQFAAPGDFVGARLLRVGHINDTYLVDCFWNGRPGQFIFQRINHFVFRDPERLMANFEKITSHIRAKLEKIPGRDPDRETLNLLPARTGACFHVTPAGEYWRAYRFVGGAHIINVASRPEEAFEAGRAFGCFQTLLSDLDASSLHETIPFFHHTPRRFARFKETLENDPQRRAGEARDAISFVLEREGLTPIITEGLASGRLPLRITHNDTKINNVLFDDLTGKAICVIDLDTTMPGSSLYDFGDMVRTTTSFAAEDETDLSRVKVELEMFRALAAGYLDEARHFLTPLELDLLVFSGRLITFTIGLRFLTDFLEGDVYFRVDRPGHNLDRARAQFGLVRSMENLETAMDECIANLRGQPGGSAPHCRSSE
jgi:Ser/Thr protein kinase RdoA (MazF antagonist)